VVARVAELGLTTAELARRVEATGAEVSRPSLSQYLNGKTDLGGERLAAVLAALGLAVVAAEGE
jgi:transcriptional regulator with XRE-family HTH domain